MLLIVDLKDTEITWIICKSKLKKFDLIKK